MAKKLTIGQKRKEKQAAKQGLDSLKTPEAWGALSATQRWEVVRRVLLVLLRREFKDSGAAK